MSELEKLRKGNDIVVNKDIMDDSRIIIFTNIRECKI